MLSGLPYHHRKDKAVLASGVGANGGPATGVSTLYVTGPSYRLRTRGPHDLFWKGGRDGDKALGATAGVPTSYIDWCGHVEA